MDAVRDARVQLNIQQKGRWLNIQRLLEGPGYRCDPLNQDSALGGGLADSLLATLGIGWIYQFDRGKTASISPWRRKRATRCATPSWPWPWACRWGWLCG